jgi:hypothetical protein
MSRSTLPIRDHRGGLRLSVLGPQSGILPPIFPRASAHRLSHVETHCCLLRPRSVTPAVWLIVEDRRLSDLSKTAGARRGAQWHASSRGNHPSVAFVLQHSRARRAPRQTGAALVRPRSLFLVLAPLARRRGYQGSYPEYLTRPPSAVGRSPGRLTSPSPTVGRPNTRVEPTAFNSCGTVRAMGPRGSRGKGGAMCSSGRPESILRKRPSRLVR